MGRRTAATGAGRTDTGVHALGQGVGFLAGGRWAEDVPGLYRALNALLPRDIWVERVCRMRPGFHARNSALARRYRYVIGTDDAARSPFRRPYEWAFGRPLDVALLARAAELLAGEHDFRGLAATGAGSGRPHYRSRVALAQWAPRTDGAGVTFTIEADRFLHRMVRFLVGAMVDVALGRRPLEDRPRLLAEQAGDLDPRDVLKEICSLVDGPVSAEVVAVDADAMVREGQELAKIADNIVVKIPMLEAGMVAVRRLAEAGIKTNVTLCFSSVQCLIAAKAGASYVSPFIGRLDDVGQEGMDVIREARVIFDNYQLATEILAASIRHPRHVVEAAMIGADVATLPPEVLRKLLQHPLTDRGLEQFLADWSKLAARAKAAV